MLPSSDKDAAYVASSSDRQPHVSHAFDDCEAMHASVREAPHDRSSLTKGEQFVVLLFSCSVVGGVGVLIGAAVLVDDVVVVSAPMDHEAVNPSRKIQSSDVNSTCRYPVLDV